MKVQKYDEALREKVGSALALALRLARLGGGTTVPPDVHNIIRLEVIKAFNEHYQ